MLENLEDLIGSVGDIIDLLVPIVFAVAILFFLWNLARYIMGGAEDKSKAKDLMVWSVVALTVMAVVWGLVEFLADAFDLDVGTPAPDVSDLTPPTN